MPPAEGIELDVPLEAAAELTEGKDLNVWCLFAMHSNLQSGETLVGTQEIASMLNCHVNTVLNSIDRLLEKGYLVRRGSQRHDTYFVALRGQPVKLSERRQG